MIRANTPFIKKYGMSMKKYIKTLAVISTVFGWHSVAQAQDNLVVLKSFDQNFEVTGELLGFDNESFNIRTAIGDLNVGREFVECSGAACPGAEPQIADNGEVMLTSGDGTSFTGKLLDYDGTNYVLETSIGVLTIRSEFVQCTGLSCPGGSAVEEDKSIRLTSGDGTFFEGDLVEFDGTNYIIETSLGVLTIRGEFVQCEGAACPDTRPQIAAFAIASPAGVGEIFVGDALKRFASEKSQNLSRSIMLGGAQINYLIGGQDGNQIADITVIPANDIESIKALFSGEATYALTREAFSAEDIAIVTNMAVPDVSALLNQQTIALDALTAHLHITNGIQSISIAHMANIMAGNMTNWAQVGGDDAPINVHVLAADTNLARLIDRDLLTPNRLRLSSNVTVHESLEALSNAVADDPFGFTVSYRSDSTNTRVLGSAAHVREDEHDERVEHGTRIPSTRNTCNIFSTPDSFSIQTEEYPLTMRWHLYSLKTADIPDYASRFAEYLQSDEGQHAAETAGLVGLAIDRRQMADQGERLLSAMLADTVNNAGIRAYQNYLKEVSTGYRLSATMRFLTGTSQLDERSIQDWERVSKLISSGMMEGNNLILAGFSDSVGDFGNNISLSRARAEYVKSVVLQENAGVLFSEDVLTFGFGPVAPVGCNTTLDGRSLNRRVEVWVRGDNEVPLR